MTNITKHTNQDDLTWLRSFSKITVVGLGMSGVGVCRYLSEMDIPFTVQDTRDNPASLEDVSQLPGLQDIHLGSLDQESLLQSDLVVVSPGISLQTPELKAAKDAGVTITGDVDIVAKTTSVPIIAITGSNGKSTVTELAGDVCKAAGLHTFVGGNIGLSVMELLNGPTHTDAPTFDVAVLELSSFQLETTAGLAASSAVILNISPDHLDRYNGSVDEYAMSKLSVYQNAISQVWNRADKWLNKQAGFTAQNVTTFGLDKPMSENDYGLCDYEGATWLVKGDKRLILKEDISLLGEHNIENVLSVYALLDHLNLSLAKVNKTIMAFTGLPHRMQKVRKLNGITWVNDSKATNVGATIAAINGLKGKIVLLAGGEGKGANFSELNPWLEKYVTDSFLFGADSKEMHLACCQVTNCSVVGDLQEAVTKASKKAVDGQYVLLAPACASFDMFHGFEHRGEQFMQMVEAL